MMKKEEAEYPYKLGIALSGGGARGFAHLGVLQAMEEHGLLPEVIAGTSAGALAGVFYADGYTPQEIYQIFRNVKITEIMTTTLPQEGFFKTKGLQHILRRHLHARTFEELKIPLYVVASDIEQGKAKVFCKGDLVPAVISSCAIPVVFAPVEIGGSHYVDGGLFQNFPVSVIRDQCRRLIGVDVSPVTIMKYDKSLKYIIERTMNYMVGANTLEEMKKCDYLLASGEISRYSLFDLKYADEIYTIGYQIATDYLHENKELIMAALTGKNKAPKMSERVKSFLQSLGMKEIKNE